MLVCCLFAVDAAAAKFSYTYKGVTFTCKTKGNTACITEFDVDATTVVIPAVVQNGTISYPVTEVSTYISGCNYFTQELVIEEGVQTIANFCFIEFRNLVKVTLPSTIQRMGKNAFRKDRAITFIKSEPDPAAINANNNYLAQAEAEKMREQAAKELADAEAEAEKMRKQAAKEMAEAEEMRKKAAKEMAEAEANENEDKKSKAGVGGLLKKGLGLFAKSKDKPKTAEKEIAVVKTEIAENKPVEQPKEKQSIPDEQNIDMDIPVIKGKVNDNLYCVIIANETYEQVPDVKFALNDGNTFKEYCIKTLGIPEKNIKTYLNASFTDMRRAFSFMEQISNLKKGNSKFIFYYAGHGIPSEADQTAYLLPTDGYPTDVATCIRLKEMYQRFGKMQSENVLVLLDACFSGVQRGSGGAMVEHRGITRVKNETLTGNVVAFSAASGEQTAMAYKDAGHGMFTYHLLNKLKATKGNITLGELVNHVKEKVGEDAILINDKPQTPSVVASPLIKAKWANIKF